MILFYGWGSKTKQLNLSAKDTCDVCHQDSSMRVFVQYDYFSLFFIQIIKWNKHYSLVCPHCGSVFTIDKQTYLNIKNGTFTPRETQTQQAVQDPFGGEFENKPENDNN